MKKKVLRMCVVTRERLEKKDLIRIVKTKEGNVFIDDTYKANGRGVYVKKDKDVIKKLIKGKILNKVFEKEIDISLYEDIKEKIS